MNRPLLPHDLDLSGGSSSSDRVYRTRLRAPQAAWSLFTSPSLGLCPREAELSTAFTVIFLGLSPGWALLST